MDVRAFKKVIMRLNTENADVVRDYYFWNTRSTTSTTRLRKAGTCCHQRRRTVTKDVLTSDQRAIGRRLERAIGTREGACGARE